MWFSLLFDCCCCGGGEDDDDEDGGIYIRFDCAVAVVHVVFVVVVMALCLLFCWWLYTEI